MCMPSPGQHPLQGFAQTLSDRMGAMRQNATLQGQNPMTGGPMQPPALTRGAPTGGPMQPPASPGVVRAAPTGGPMQSPAWADAQAASGPVAPRSAPPGGGYINGPR